MAVSKTSNFGVPIDSILSHQIEDLILPLIFPKYFHRAKFLSFPLPTSLSFSSALPQNFHITIPLLHFQRCLYRKSKVLNEDEMNILWSKIKYQGLLDSSPAIVSSVTIEIFTVSYPYFHDLLPGAKSLSPSRFSICILKFVHFNSCFMDF